MKKQKYSMWMAYTKKDFKSLNEDTHLLSMEGARFEVWHSAGEYKVWVQVRCHKESRIYYLCESLHYLWSSFQPEES